MSMISIFMNDHSKLHYAAKKKLKYLQESKKQGTKNEKKIVIKWFYRRQKKKSNSVYHFSLCTMVTSWRSSKQKSIAIDITCKAIWLRRILLDVLQMHPITIYWDNMFSVVMIKRIELCHHFIK
ncbi:unnamed protein product, partial [Musa hybrid cultivar]